MSEPGWGRRQRLRGWAVGCVLLALLAVASAGCTAGPGEATTLPPVSPSVTGSQEVSAPTVSPSGTDEEQIEAAIRAYFDAMDTRSSTRETQLRSLP